MLRQKIERWLEWSWLPKLLSILLILFILLTVYRDVLFFREINQFSNIHKSDHLPNNPVIPLQAMPEWHLFGESVFHSNSIPLSRLSIKLTGIFYSVYPKNSSISMVLNDKETIYHTGEALPNGVIIEKILPNNVIIRYQNRLERLTMYDPKHS